ncbi:mismatch-specific DNA-glycosylase [Ancylobacter oerskovii]
MLLRRLDRTGAREPLSFLRCCWMIGVFCRIARGRGNIRFSSRIVSLHRGALEFQRMLPDYLSPALDVIFCGTAAGRRSAELGHYYAGRGNRFWPTLYEVGLTPALLRPQDDASAPQYGIGLTDLAKDVAGVDRDIPPTAYVPERLHAVLQEWKPKRLAFTSLTAARLGLGLRGRIGAGLYQITAIPNLEVWALPSPSGMARGHWDIAPWRALAESIRGWPA